MSLDVALQSVAFYVLSCSTCAKISHRRKTKIQAKKERAEKHALETEQPGLYRHPSPFSTNPYWDEEITMGPGPPRKKTERNCSQAALNPLVPQSSANSYTMSTGTGTGTASSPTAVEGSRASDEGWNRKRYQREDEALWGHDTPGPGQRIFDAIARAGSTAGRLLEGRLNKVADSENDENPRSYYLAKNPPVNDLHPPVVSTQPASRDETRWMLQPPPSAKVMEGKERVSRTRAVSAGSSRKAFDGSLPISRPVTEKLEVEEQRIERVQPLEEARPMLWEDLTSKAPTRNHPVGQPHERSSDDSPADAKQDLLKISTSLKEGSIDSINYVPVSSSEATHVQDTQEFPKTKKENEEFAVLRELSPLSSNSALNSRASTSSNRLSPNANSMPVTIPSVESKFPGAPGSIFPKPTTVQSSKQPGLGIDIEATKST